MIKIFIQLLRFTDYGDFVDLLDYIDEVVRVWYKKK
mgnify:CR=1 FL=1